MPHQDNRNWMSLLLGKMPAAPKRTEVADLIGSRKMWDLSHLNQNLPAGVGRREVTLRADIDPPLSGELYTPENAPILGRLLYLHGGGWCAGSAAMERQIAMRFSDCGYVVLNLDYSLAPERPFPAALEDCVYAARWLSTQEPATGPMVVGGQSAGANLAAATVLSLRSDAAIGGADLPGRDPGGPRVDFDGVLLLSGIFSFPLLLAEPGSNIGPAELWHQAYLGPNFLRRNRDPMASPMLADLAGFPAAYVACGDEDSLLGQSLGMAAALAAANVPTTVSVLSGFDHGYQFLEDRFEPVRQEMERTRFWLRGLGGDDVVEESEGSP